jgi:hypothetical protein
MTEMLSVVAVKAADSAPPCAPMAISANPPAAPIPAPTTDLLRKSGSANVVCPSPPNCVPSSENNAVFVLMGKIAPFAAA